MAFCEKCGAELESGSKFCQYCGSPVAEAVVTPNNNASNAFGNVVNEFNNAKDSTSEYDPKDIEDNKVMGILAYLGLWLVPLLAAKDSKFARFHTNQGLVLCLAILAVTFGSVILAFVPFVGCITVPIGFVAGIVSFVFSIMGIVYAAQGQAKELPLIGKIKLIK